MASTMRFDRWEDTLGNSVNMTQVSGGSGLVPITPSSVTVGSGSATVGANGAVTFTGASNITINGSFTTAYKNYRIVASELSVLTSGGSLAMQLKSDSSIFSSADYVSVGRYNSTTTGSGVSSAVSQTSWGLWYSDVNGGQNNLVVDIFTPQEAKPTSARYLATAYQNTAVWVDYSGGSIFNNSSQATGFKILHSAGALSGTIQVYGYR